MADIDPEFSSNSTSHSENSSSVFFECMDSSPGYFLIVFSTLLNVVLLLPLNCWILWLARKTSVVTSSDFVILNQSVAEVVGNTCVFTFLFGAIVKKKVIILISNYLCSSIIVGRPLFQTVYSVERYLAVVHPLIYLKYKTDPKLKLPFVGVVWLLILIFAWFVMDSFPRIPTFYIGTYLAMLILCIFCSVMILWVLKRPKPGDGEKEGSYQMKRKAFIAVTLILISLLFGYGPLSCVILLRDQLSYHTYCFALGTSLWTVLPNTAVQPYLYLSKIKRH